MNKLVNVTFSMATQPHGARLKPSSNRVSDNDRALMLTLANAPEWPAAPLTTSNLEQHLQAATAILLRSDDAIDEIRHLLRPIGAPGRNVVHLSRLFPPTALATPFEAHVSEGEQIKLQLRFLVLMQVLCGQRPVAYAHENDGEAVRNVRKSPDDTGERSSHGASADFSHHSDNPADFAPGRGEGLPELPSTLSFHCQRNFEGAATEVVHLSEVLNEFEERWPGGLGQLLQRTFWFTPPDSIRLHTGKADPVVRPIIWRDAQTSELLVRWDDGCVAGTDREADRWLYRFEDAIQAAAARAGQSFVLEPGDFFAFDNRRVLHGRRRFKAWPHEVSRWLLRLYGQPID